MSPAMSGIGTAVHLGGASEELGIASPDGQKLAAMIMSGEYPDLDPPQLAPEQARSRTLMINSKNTSPWPVARRFAAV